MMEIVVWITLKMHSKLFKCGLLYDVTVYVTSGIKHALKVHARKRKVACSLFLVHHVAF